MSKVIIENAADGQTYFSLPIHTAEATAKVNGSAATIASQNNQSITLETATAQDDVVEITFTPVDQYGQGRTERFVPLTGTTVSPTSACGLAIVDPAGTLAALTVALPSGPAEGQFFQLFTTQTLTALTLSGGTVVGGPSTLAANASVTFQYSTVTSKWYRIQ